MSDSAPARTRITCTTCLLKAGGVLWREARVEPGGTLGEAEALADAAMRCQVRRARALGAPIPRDVLSATFAINSPHAPPRVYIRTARLGADDQFVYAVSRRVYEVWPDAPVLLRPGESDDQALQRLRDTTTHTQSVMAPVTLP